MLCLWLTANVVEKEREMKKEKWVWMPHAGHCIIGDQCRFHLSTYVGKYLVSTIGEYCTERSSREINAFENIGCDRKYETMVFKAKKSKHKCCPYKMISGDNIDMDSYNDADSAYAGHLKICKKWSIK